MGGSFELGKLVVVQTAPFHPKLFCWSGRLRPQRSCIVGMAGWPERDSVALRNLVATADTLRRTPDVFYVVPRSIRLRQTPWYLGAYFTLRTATGIIVKAHSTIGHWLAPARHALTHQQERDLLRKVVAVLIRRWQFADVDPEILATRVIITIHVGSSVNNRWWGIQTSARAALRVTENPHKGRNNFHISIDTLVRPPFPLGPPLALPPPPAPALPPPPAAVMLLGRGSRDDAAEDSYIFEV